MNRNRISTALLLAAGACAGPEPEPLTADVLEEARRLADAGLVDRADDLLSDYEREDFDRVSQGQFSLLAGNIAYRNGDWDDAIRRYEEFLLFEGAAQDSRLAEDRLLELGLDLLEGRHRAFGIFPDRSRGIATLLNLAAWAPRSPRAPEALAHVGEYHFENRYFNEAREDYRLILQQYPRSEWADLAAFRLGMCNYLQIDKPTIDAKVINRSLNQLKQYMKLFPAGLYRDEAEVTIVELEELSAQHELAVGDYYEDIGNILGARRRYREAASRFGTEAAVEARRRLERLPALDPLPGAAAEAAGGRAPESSVAEAQAETTVAEAGAGTP